MKIQLLPSTFDPDGCALPEQRLTCYLVDDCVAIDAGSLALALNREQRERVRDVVVTHSHMDHVATLPIFIDDLFALLTEPVRVHASAEVIEALRRDVLNDVVYPRFDELTNDHGRVMEYVPFVAGREFRVAHLALTAVPVNHIVPTVGLVVSDGAHTLAFSSDTGATDAFWRALDCLPRLDALFAEASFPDVMSELAEVSGHLTPAGLASELGKLTRLPPEVLAVHLKPTYRQTVITELEALRIPNLRVMEPGRVYEW